MHADALLYRHKLSNGLTMIFADDILIAAPEEWLERIKKNFEKELTVKWGGVIGSEWKKYLGKQYVPERKGSHWRRARRRHPGRAGAAQVLARYVGVGRDDGVQDVSDSR